MHAAPSLQSSGVPAHVPLVQRSSIVQGSPSSHGCPVHDPRVFVQCGGAVAGVRGARVADRRTRERHVRAVECARAAGQAEDERQDQHGKDRAQPDHAESYTQGRLGGPRPAAAEPPWQVRRRGRRCGARRLGEESSADAPAPGCRCMRRADRGRRGIGDARAGAPGAGRTVGRHWRAGAPCDSRRAEAEAAGGRDATVRGRCLGGQPSALDARRRSRRCHGRVDLRPDGGPGRLARGRRSPRPPGRVPGSSA